MGYSKPPYYLTAYGLAVRQGFKGTLNEWLASLHGDGVELRYLGEKLQWRKIKGTEDPDPEEGWQDILDVAGTREAIFRKALDEADRAENAAGRAEAAAGQIVVDQEFIETQVFSVEQAAEVAAAAARDAAQSEQNTKDDAERAAGAADDAAAALARTEEVADSVGSPVSYKPQTIPEKNKVQAKENIGASTFYHTTREEVGKAHTDTDWAEYIYSLYDELMEKYPDNVQKNEAKNDDGTFTNYEYVISTGEYPEGEYTTGYASVKYGAAPDDIKKPKYLILSGIHGTERLAALSAYRFIRDILSGHNVPKKFKEGAIIHIIPVGTPSAINAFTRESAGTIDINRNFKAEEPEKETQAIKKWLNDNADADLFIDFHNNGAINEIVAILGNSSDDATDKAKKIALKGVDRVVPFWRDVIGYPPVEAYYYDTTDKRLKLGTREVVFSYSSDLMIEGTAQWYASNEKHITSVTIEVSIFYGDESDRNGDTTYPPETIAAGAEAIGNILLEFYKESFSSEVIDDMKAIDSKLDTLLLANSFRVENGEITLSDMTASDKYGTVEVTIPCTSGAKTVIFEGDDQVYADATSKTDGYYYAISANVSFIEELTGANSVEATKQKQGYSVVKAATQGISFGAVHATNNDSCKIQTYSLVAGTYRWKAYYWDE